MTTLRRILTTVLCVGAASSLALASTITGQLTSTYTASGGPTAFNFSGATSVPLSVSQFSCGLLNCQLTSIHFGVSSTTTSNYSVTNNSGGADDITINANSIITIAGAAAVTNPKFVIATPSSTTTFTLADGATQTGSASATGSATADYTCAGATCTLSTFTGNSPAATINSAPFNAGTGTGNITVFAKGLNAGFAACAACTVTISGTASETLSVQYDYSYDVADTGTPEPATMALMGSALLGLGLVGKKFRR